MLATLTIRGWIEICVGCLLLFWACWEFIIDFYRRKCQKAYLRGDLDNLEKTTNRILKIKPKDFFGLGYKALFCSFKGQYEKVQEIGEKILKIANKKKNNQGKVYALNLLSNSYRECGNLEKAEKYVKDALDSAKKSNIKEEMSRIYNNLGLIYQDRNEWEHAEEMFDKAIKSFLKKDISDLAKIYCNLGINFKKQGNLIKSEEVLNEALKISEKYSLSECSAANLAELGSVSILKGEIEKGQELLEKSLAISESKGMVKLSANQYSNLGLLYKSMGNKEKAKEYWIKARNLFEKMELANEVEKVQKLINDSEFE